MHSFISLCSVLEAPVCHPAQFSHTKVFWRSYFLARVLIFLYTAWLLLGFLLYFCLLQSVSHHVTIANSGQTLQNFERRDAGHV